MVAGMQFLSKKGFNPQNQTNRKRVWEAEQRKLQEEAKAKELAKQIAAEREQEELDKIAGKKSGRLDRGIDWMYSGQQANSEVALQDAAKRSEEYLLGKAYVPEGGAAAGDFGTDAHAHEGVNAVVSETLAAPPPAAASHYQNTEPTPAERNEAFRHRHEDPMFAVAMQAKHKKDEYQKKKEMYERVMGGPTDDCRKTRDDDDSRSRQDSKRRKKDKRHKKSRKKHDRKRRRHYYSSEDEEDRHHRRRHHGDRKRSRRSKSPEEDEDSLEDRHRSRSHHHRNRHYERSRSPSPRYNDRNNGGGGDYRHPKRYSSDDRDKNDSYGYRKKDHHHRDRSSQRYRSSRSPSPRSSDYHRHRKRHDSYDSRPHSSSDDRRTKTYEESKDKDLHTQEPIRNEKKAGYGLQGGAGATTAKSSSGDLGPDKELLRKKRREREEQKERNFSSSQRKLTAEEREAALREMEDTAQQYQSHRELRPTLQDEDTHQNPQASAAFLQSVARKAHGVEGGISLQERISQNRSTNQRLHDDFM